MTTVDRALVYEAAGLVVSTQFGSTSMVRRQLGVSREVAVEIMTVLEENGIVGPDQYGRARDVLVRAEQREEARQDWAPPAPGGAP